MSRGLRIWRPDGQIMLDVTDRLSRIHGSVTLPNIAFPNSVNFSVPGMILDGTWFLFVRGSLPQNLVITQQTGNINVRNGHSTVPTGGGTVIDILRG